MKLGIIGGGINGVCTAWQLALAGHEVSLFERGKLLGETSTASSKLLHGGLRYLENFEFRLVKEALHERAWWLKHVPQHTTTLQLCLPIYKWGRRSRWKMRLGLMLYDGLAGTGNIGKHQSVPIHHARQQYPELKSEGLTHMFTFFDGQMDEERLGEWVARQARQAGARLLENTEVRGLDKDASLSFENGDEKFDGIINITGPWAAALNKKCQISSQYQLDLVRGSHLVLDRQARQGYLLEVPEIKHSKTQRIFFVLPYQGKTLVGTTEIRQGLDEPIECSEEERKYLLKAYNHYFVRQASEQDIFETFAGIRPLIKSCGDPGRATREYAIERQGKMMTVYGGKWTTARALAKKIVKEVDHGFY